MEGYLHRLIIFGVWLILLSAFLHPVVFVNVSSYKTSNCISLYSVSSRGFTITTDGDVYRPLINIRDLFYKPYVY